MGLGAPGAPVCSEPLVVFEAVARARALGIVA